ncbi:hypothetical protein SUGI_0064740 [Cryptomeria japonica]|nr:hypothetical protein SUGI_0064740 [Cryptomeria japonica]
MDGEMENLQSLDAVEIITEALKILRRASKLLGSIAFSLLLPLSFAILGHRKALSTACAWKFWIFFCCSGVHNPNLGCLIDVHIGSDVHSGIHLRRQRIVLRPGFKHPAMGLEARGVVGLNIETLVIGFIGIAIVAVSFHVYIATVWHVANAVCGGGELRIGGHGKEQNNYRKLGRDFSTNSLGYLVYGEWRQGMSGGVIVVVVLQCGVDLVWLLTHCVL